MTVEALVVCAVGSDYLWMLRIESIFLLFVYNTELTRA